MPRPPGKIGVCCATSGPGATNLVTGLVDAMMDSVPIVALTGQVSTTLIGSDAFQEADTFGITRSCTKHNFMVKTLAELPQIIHEAFYIAGSGRPGPVLVDVPKDVFMARGHYEPVTEIHLPGYKVFTEGHSGQIRRAAQMMWEAERPMIYAGGGIILGKAHNELRELVELLDAPAVCTLMGLGGLPGTHPNFISMPGMHGSYAANMAMYNTDLLIALGVRFDDRVTGRLSSFAPHARVIHVDIDPAEIGKNRAADIPIVGDLKRVLSKLSKVVAELKPGWSRRNPKRAKPGGSRSATGRKSIRWLRRRLRRRDQAAACDGGDRSHLERKSDRHRRCRPAPDVGRAVHPVQRTEPVAELRRTRLHGLWPAGRDRRAVRVSRQAGVLDRRRRRLPDVGAGTRHHRRTTACRSRSSS